MIRLGSLVGLPAALDGRLVGLVEETVVTRDGTALRGLVVRHGFGGAKWVDAQDVLVLGDVSIILRRKPGRMPGDADFRLGSVKDSAGLNLGRVTDVYIHRGSFQVEAVEVSLGLKEEFTLGRMLARSFVVRGAGDEPGQVLIPCGAALERLQ